MTEIIIPSGGGSTSTRPVLDSGNRIAHITGMYMVGRQAPAIWNQSTHRFDPAEYTKEGDNFTYESKDDTGKPKTRTVPAEVYVEFEIDGERVESDDGDEMPYLMTKNYNLVGGERAALTKLFTAVDPAGTKAPNLHLLLGETCSVELIKKDKADGSGSYNKIGSVSGKPNIPNWEPEKPFKNEFSIFSLTDPDWEAYQAMPRWLQKVCKESLDFPGSGLQKLLAEQETQTESTEEYQLPHAV